MVGPVLLRAWRERNKRSQAECSVAVGVRQSTWSDWEGGRKSPQIKFAGRIAHLTGDEVPMMAWTDRPAIKNAPAAPPSGASLDVHPLDKASGE